MVAKVCQELPILDQPIFEPQGDDLRAGRGDLKCLAHDIQLTWRLSRGSNLSRNEPHVTSCPVQIGPNRGYRS